MILEISRTKLASFNDIHLSFLGLVLDLLPRQSIWVSLHLESRSRMEGLILGLALDPLV